jgi:very-short-patch-repair endonuclease
VIIDGEKFRIDMLFLPEMLAVEPSGFRWHSGRLKWGIDRRRERMLVSMGYRIFPVTWNDVKYERAETIRLLRRALSVAA